MSKLGIAEVALIASLALTGCSKEGEKSPHNESNTNTIENTIITQIEDVRDKNNSILSKQPTQELSNNNQNISQISSDLTVNGNNSGNTNTVSGDIVISKNNSHNITTVSGDISIGGNNSGAINNVSGDISIGGNNSGEISNVSGDIELSDNNGNIANVSGDTSVKSNAGLISTVAGYIQIGTLNISSERNSSSSGSGNYGVLIGSVIIINGKRQETSDSQENKYIVSIGGLKIDFYKNQFTNEKGIVENIGNGNKNIKKVGKKIIVLHGNQTITISEDMIEVQGK